MFGRVPSADCHHSNTGICPKCTLEQSYNLNSKPAAVPSADRFLVTSHTQSPPRTSILDVFELSHHSPAAYNGLNTYLPDGREQRRFFHSLDSSSSASQEPPMPAVAQPAFSATIEEAVQDTARPTPTDPHEQHAQSRWDDGRCIERRKSSATVRNDAANEETGRETEARNVNNERVEETGREAEDGKGNNARTEETGREAEAGNGNNERAEETVRETEGGDGARPPDTAPVEESATQRNGPKPEPTVNGNGGGGGPERSSGSSSPEEFTSFEALRHEQLADDEEESEASSGLGPEKVATPAKQLPQSLVRLFDSDCFNMEIALRYLFMSDNVDVVMYLGKILHRFPAAAVDFFIPQLITMYIHHGAVASALHAYMVERCRRSMAFSLECYWLLQAHDVEQFKTDPRKVQGFFLRETIFNEYMKSHQPLFRTPAANAAIHHRSRSDARLAEPDSISEPCTPPSSQPAHQVQPMDNVSSQQNGTTMRRTESTRSVRSLTSGNHVADLSSGRAFDTSCHCVRADSDPQLSPALSDVSECTCGADQKTRPELAFVEALMGIGNRLRRIAAKEDKSRRLVYELFLLNLNLPARVWLPLYARPHHLVRIPYAEGCVLNSKDKAPYCIYCEVVQLAAWEAQPPLPEKKVELEGEFHMTMRSGSMGSMYNIGSPNNAHLATSFGLPTLSPVEEAEQKNGTTPAPNGTNGTTLAAPTIAEPNDDEVLTQFDRIIDETLSVADSDDLSSQFSADCEYREEPQSKFEKIRSRLAALKRRRRQRMAHSPDDPSASAMSEPWEEKQNRIRQASPYGDLPGWKLLPVIVKTGDDLRQELLAYQLLTTLENIWRDESVPLYLRPYRILVCSADSGMIEPIPNACSLHQIKKNLSARPSLDDAAQPYTPTLLSHFLINYGSRLSEPFQQAQANFVRSCAAYSLACYFLQVKDRHNGNILLDSEGHLIHIDFGYILSISPKNLGFETSPFKLTQELVEVMGGPHSDLFRGYKELIFNGMVAARKHSERIMNIVEVMSHDSQLPCFRGGPSVLRMLRERFHLGSTEQQLRAVVNQLVEQSRDSLTTRLYDNFQYYTNGIF